VVLGQSRVSSQTPGRDIALDKSSTTLNGRRVFTLDDRGKAHVEASDDKTSDDFSSPHNCSLPLVGRFLMCAAKKIIRQAKYFGLLARLRVQCIFNLFLAARTYFRHSTGD
jgi:hypothetical protein